MCKKSQRPIAGLVRSGRIMPPSATIALPVMDIIVEEKLKLL
ncbi:MAG: hypothetical protein P8Z79_22160 [Sedimentisphaerales bacterium]|jgi:hypothetical protein